MKNKESLGVLWWITRPVTTRIFTMRMVEFKWKVVFVSSFFHVSFGGNSSFCTCGSKESVFRSLGKSIHHTLLCKLFKKKSLIFTYFLAVFG